MLDAVDFMREVLYMFIGKPIADFYKRIVKSINIKIYKYFKLKESKKIGLKEYDIKFTMSVSDKYGDIPIEKTFNIKIPARTYREANRTLERYVKHCLKINVIEHDLELKKQ